MSWWVPPRRADPEWMDAPGHSPEALGAVLADLRRVNAYLGGRRALLAATTPYLYGHTGGAPVRVLDLGTGDADLPRTLATHARALGRAAHVVAVDRDATIARLARVACDAEDGGRAVRVLRGDAFRLPFGDDTFDLVTASMFLHHFEHDAAVAIVREALRVCRRALIVNDLLRHRVPWFVARTVGRIGFRHPMSRHDGPLSVLKGFRPGELRAIAGTAGGRDVRVVRRLGYRVVLTVSPS